MATNIERGAHAATAVTRASPGAAHVGSAGEICAWLLGAGKTVRRVHDLLDGTCRRLLSADVPIWRMMISIQTLHPQILTTGYRWRCGMAHAEQVDQGHDILDSQKYLTSPLKVIHDGAPHVRRRLEGPDAVLDFPILVELQQSGATDYVILPLPFSDGSIHIMSFASDRPGGFSEADMALIEAILPPLAAILEIHATRRIAATLLDTYLGPKTGARVLSGQITRGSGETIQAVVWYSDLRGFTRMSDTMPRDRVIAVLNDYFECLIGAIEAGGGEVLKLIGDAVLAIFPTEDAAFRYVVCHRALDTARKARMCMMALNCQRQAAGEPALRYGTALHLGKVIYGNIGAPDRLDFTVIGPAVNHVTRIEELCKTTGHDLLVSRDVAANCERPLVSLGRHRLRGVAEPQEIFTLPPEAGDDDEG